MSLVSRATARNLAWRGTTVGLHGYTRSRTTGEKTGSHKIAYNELTLDLEGYKSYSSMPLTSEACSLKTVIHPKLVIVSERVEFNAPLDTI